MSQALRRSEYIFEILLRSLSKQRCFTEHLLFGAKGCFHLPFIKLKNVPLIINRGDVIGLVLCIKRPLRTPLVAPRCTGQDGGEREPQLLPDRLILDGVDCAPQFDEGYGISRREKVCRSRQSCLSEAGAAEHFSLFTDIE